MASASSSSPFFGIRDEDLQNQIKQQQQQKPTSSASAPAAAPVKKRRNQPGNPSPDAEVIALSPKTLMATNRFICEVCNKGFQREQNLQLHRRGHNLPWKLKQKSGKEHEVRRRVYLCPEPSCVHHHPSRALGDLTGIKKHFCRKHGEKKWKCDKCSKRYAVHSDLKAHAKTCGTREYRCDCGTLFSRRDSFITHRAFCDALAQESTRQPAAGVGAATGFSSFGSHLFRNNTASMAAFGGLSPVNTQLASLQDQTHPSTDLLRLGGASGAASQFEHLLGPTNPHPFRPAQPPQPPFFLDAGSNHPDFNNPELQTKSFQGLMHLPDLQGSAASAPNLFNLNSSSSTNTNNNNNAVNGGGQQNHLPFSGGNLITDHVGGESLTSIYNAVMQNEPLLPQMSATALLQKAAQMGSTASGGATCTGTGAGLLRGFSGTGPRTQMDHSETQLTNLMNSLANGGASGLFSVGFGPYVDGGLCIDDMDETKYNLCNNVGLNLGAGSDRLTRDFLGVGGMVRMPRALDPELRSQSSSRSFGSGPSGSLQ